MPEWSSGQDSALSLPEPGSAPGWGIKIPQAEGHGQKIFKKPQQTNYDDSSGCLGLDLIL